MKKLLTLIISLALLPFNILASEIYTYEEIIPIAEGVTLTKVESFHSDHNLSYSYITVDLTNDKVGLSLLKSQKGLDYSDTTLNLAKGEENVVAALNGDFFSSTKGGKTISLGIEVKDGNLLQSPIYPDTMATFSSTDKEIFLDYLSFTVAVVAPNWEFAPIRHINKHTEYFGEILMYQGDFNGGFSPAPGGPVVEILVEDGILTEFRRDMPPCPIPENGYILSVSEGVSMFFANNFQVGDPVKIDYYITPDISNSDVALGGGALLVSEGKAPESFSHVVSGYNPRSAIGISEDGNTLYLVAVNGRQEKSRGMSMAELADLMVDLGCYKALNLDGGGSTYMAASTPWVPEIHKVNSPSETRAVINALGITFDAEEEKEKGILLESDKSAVFIGEEVKLSSALYDKNLRPKEGTITYSSSKGDIKEGIFTAKEGGIAKIKAKSGSVTSEIEVFVVDKITGIDAPDTLKLKVGESQKLSFNVFDKEGHFVSVENIKPFTITSSNPSVISVKDGVVTSLKNGAALISIKKDNAESYISVVSGEDEIPYTLDFTKDNGSFSSYPAYVGGDYSVNDGTGVLSFDFSQDTEEDKAAYFVLEEPITLSSSSREIKLDLKTESFVGHELKALFTDRDGKELRISLGRDFSEDADLTLSGIIPESVKAPLTLKRIYILATGNEDKDEGVIYLDNLSVTTSSPIPFMAKSENIYDDITTPSKNGEKINIGALSGSSDTLIKILTDGKMKETLSSSKYFYTLGTNSSFRTEESDKALFIALDTKAGGIRKTDKKNWDLLKNAIDKSSKPFVFILSDNSLFGSDGFENKVLKDYLASIDKKVTVVTKSDYNTLKIIDGVRYFTLADISGDAPLLSRIENLSYLEFTLGEDLSYEIKKIIK